MSCLELTGLLPPFLLLLIFLHGGLVPSHTADCIYNSPPPPVAPSFTSQQDPAPFFDVRTSTIMTG